MILINKTHTHAHQPCKKDHIENNPIILPTPPFLWEKTKPLFFGRFQEITPSFYKGECSNYDITR